MKEEKFLSPRSRLIVSVGVEINCDDYFPPIYHIDEQWYSIINGRFLTSQRPINMEMEKVTDWEFEPVKGISHRGIYSSDDMENYRKSVNEPLSQNALEKNFYNSFVNYDNSINGQDTSVMGFINDKIINEVKKNVFGPFAYIHTHFTNFDNIMSGILGVIVIFKAIKFSFNLIFNSFLLINIFGFTWRLIFAFWDSVVYCIIKEKKCGVHFTM